MEKEPLRSQMNGGPVLLLHLFCSECCYLLWFSRLLWELRLQWTVSISLWLNLVKQKGTFSNTAAPTTIHKLSLRHRQDKKIKPNKNDSATEIDNICPPSKGFGALIQPLKKLNCGCLIFVFFTSNFLFSHTILRIKGAIIIRMRWCAL